MSDAWNLFRNRPKKYTSFSLALKTSWKLYKRRMDIQNRSDEINEFHESVNREREERNKRIEISNARPIKEVETKIVSEEYQSSNYGYGRGSHYNIFSGYGRNYCGD
jgi:coproporphyrinogen III oxidase-like Fe-S oxidoreductase